MKKTFWYVWKAFQLTWKANRWYAMIMILGRLYESTFYPLIQVLLLTKTIDLFSHNSNIAPTSLLWIFIAFIVASILKHLLKTLIDIKEAFLQAQMEGYIDLEISRKLTTLDPATFENSEFQNLLAQLDGVKGTMQMHVIRSVGLLDAIIKFATSVVVLGVIFPLFGPIILISCIPSYIAWDKARQATWPYFVEKKSLLIRVTTYIKDLLSSDTTSKEAAIFRTSPALLEKIKKEQRVYFRDFDKVNTPWITYIFLARLVQLAAFAYTQYASVIRVMAGALSIGQFTLVFQQTYTLAFSAEEILNQYSSISARNKYVDKYYAFLATKPHITSPAETHPISNTPKTPVIQFKNVSFAYPGTKRFILHKFSLTIKSGEKIAFVGENGAGKSTIIKLLLRFYDVTEGEITINGTDIKTVALKDWHAYIGALFQDFIKYQFTFKENVLLGDITKSSDEKLFKEAITKSGAAAYLYQLPDGIDQVVGKMFGKGIDLSGGQWQKLALARAFFRNAPILVLDEPTSAIDAKAEYEIFENVQKLQNDKTVIIISHRFSTVRNADRIVVLDNGRIIEEGSHNKLMKKKGLYAELFNIQAQGYK